MLNLPSATWIRFFVWMAIGFVVYFTYSARHSRLVDRPELLPRRRRGCRGQAQLSPGWRVVR